MGFLDSIMKGSETDDVKGSGTGTSPFKVTMNFLPLRLAAMKDNKVNMFIRITNTSGGGQLVSVDVALPRNQLVGFDPTCINKHMEKRVGQLNAGESTEVVLPIWGNNQTKDGNYPIGITVYAHYLDYTKVINSVKKSASLRVV